MQEQFKKELNNALVRVQDSIAPYTRFVRAEQKKTEAMQEQVLQLDNSLVALKSEIEQVR